MSVNDPSNALCPIATRTRFRNRRTNSIFSNSRCTPFYRCTIRSCCGFRARSDQLAQALPNCFFPLFFLRLCVLRIFYFSFSRRTNDLERCITMNKREQHKSVIIMIEFVRICKRSTYLYSPRWKMCFLFFFFFLFRIHQTHLQRRTDVCLVSLYHSIKPRIREG